ncbi:MAG: hypothetical protein LBI33_07420 [Propionibacteriaceae bacterium]|jgi:ABC-2 type transport system permease protein|nr:hypothetical protein [Propionibacteriaceae bacterium]
MSTVVAQPGVGQQREDLAHLKAFTVFTLRRNWVRFLVWTLIIVGMLGFIASYYQQMFTDPKELQLFIDTVHSPAMLAMVGIISNPTSIAGAVWCKFWMFGSLMFAIGVMFLMTRNLRADEDQGRAELVRSYPLGIHSRLAAAVINMTVLSVVVGVLSGAVLASMNLTDAADAAQGAFVLGLSITGMGLLGVGVGALVNELSPSSGAANGTGAAIFAVFYLLRMVGDMNTTWTLDAPPAGWGLGLTWVSPIGWGQLMDPWGANRWYPLVFILALTVILVGVAWLVQARRDLGASLARARVGKADASALTTTVWGLGLRLQRSSLIGWFIGVIVFGGALGSVIGNMADLLKNLPIADTMNGLDSVMGVLFVPMLALVVGVFAAQSATMMRSDEAHGVLESQLGTSVGRVSWALQRLAVTVGAVIVMLLVVGLIMGSSYDALVPGEGKLAAVVGAYFVYLPSVLLLAAIFMLGFGWWPRYAVAVTWIVVGALWAFMIIGLALKIPEAVLNLMPFNVMAHVPAEPMDWVPFAVMSVITIGLTVVGLIGFRRRNIPA